MTCNLNRFVASTYRFYAKCSVKVSSEYFFFPIVVVVQWPKNLAIEILLMWCIVSFFGTSHTPVGSFGLSRLDAGHVFCTLFKSTAVSTVKLFLLRAKGLEVLAPCHSHTAPHLNDPKFLLLVHQNYSVVCIETRRALRARVIIKKQIGGRAIETRSEGKPRELAVNRPLLIHCGI
ncbi:hypothetical protein IQ07DRAFT_600934 [Pyrenochaeta sp. DS3sAY3a]|nr:hypothetical protein IQ07DRAFT_600934 [Pyrenochaeta sp. DS3sAY3a]